MQTPITYLFVPGNRPERFDKALSSGADAVILDLEDAVSADDKTSARGHVVDWGRAHATDVERIVVRINGATTPWFDADVAAVADAGLWRVMLPKAETAAHVDAVIRALGADARVLALIETALGVRDVGRVAEARGVDRLAFGTLDYGVDLDLSGDERGLIHAASQIAIASRCAGLASPVTGVTAAIGDDQRLLADLAFARALGFGAKLCIHPRQIAVIREALVPSAVELDWARRVVAAAESAHGAVQVDGRMVDRPVVLRARGILDRAR